ncbi:hypothetical protein [Egbenema bharatensis]|uniref:hypothetical protein n=1 Tax=Egbenema bharatensis TaxID=3463334 RepID=UPI003A840777
MRYLVIIGLMFCFLLTGCEYFIPHTSKALSDSSQLEELRKQTRQIEKQTEALEELADSAEKLAAPRIQAR